MKNEFVTVRNTVTRRVGTVRRRIAEHPVHGLYLEIVPSGSKDYVDLDALVQEKREKKPSKPVVEAKIEDEDEV